MTSIANAVALLLTIAAILGVLAQMHGSITTDGEHLRFFSPDPSGSFLFNNMDLLARLTQLAVWNCCKLVSISVLQDRVTSAEAKADLFEVENLSSLSLISQ